MILTKQKRQVSLPALIKRAQACFNTYIRLRDKNNGCISCGSEVTEAGHYYSAGHYSALRFNETNTNGQCTRCNCFLSGNLIHYRNGLIKKYGEQKVLLLDASCRNHHKWSRLELEIICTEYKQKIKELK